MRCSVYNDIVLDSISILIDGSVIKIEYWAPIHANHLQKVFIPLYACHSHLLTKTKSPIYRAFIIIDFVVINDAIYLTAFNLTISPQLLAVINSTLERSFLIPATSPLSSAKL